MTHRHFPRYNDDTDYTTNAPSYYDDLARKEKLIRLLAERIWGYEKILDETLEEIQERFRAWDKNLEDFPDDVKILLQQWLDNGTLDHIINETIFNWKLDTTIFEQFRDSITAQLQQLAIDIGNLGAKDEVSDPSFDNTSIFNQAFSKLPDGGIVKLPPNKTFIVAQLDIPSNITLDLNGSTLKLKSGVANYINVINVGIKGIAKNVTIKNGKIDGNKTNQQSTLYRYGIYTLGCDNVHIENIESFNHDGEGIFVGYTGYYSKNIFMRDIYLHDNDRNDLAVTNAENVFIENMKIDSIAYNSASLDLELQHNTDNIINVHINNLEINSNIQQAKVVKNGYTGRLENISITNAKFTGSRALGVEDAEFVNLTNITSEAPIEIIGSRNVTVNGLKVNGVVGNGLYIYQNEINGNKTENLFLTNIEVSGSSQYGILLQEVKTAFVSSVNTYNNAKSGIGILYGNNNVKIVNVISTDKRTTGKTQPYGIEFQGINTDISLVSVYVDGNLNGEYLNLPTDVYLVGKDRIMLKSPDNSQLLEIKVANDGTFNFSKPPTMGYAKFNNKISHMDSTVAKGSLYEDKFDGTLKYVTQSGTRQEVSTKKASGVPTSTSYWYSPGDIIYNSVPASGGYVGWVCVAGGAPGTWKSFGLIQA